MNRLPALLLPTLLFLLPVNAAGQSPADEVTGLASSSKKLGAQDLLGYMRAIRSGTAVIEFDPRGASYREFGAGRIRLTAHWRKPRGGGAPVLTGATIEPVGSKYFKIGKHKIYKLKINSKGEIYVDRRGINVTIYKITPQPNGDMVMDFPWWSGGDETVKKEDSILQVKKWPPTLDDLVNGFLQGRKTSKRGKTIHQGRIAWHIRGNADAHAFPFKGGELEAASRFDIRGAAYLYPDGSFRTLGNGNRVKLNLHVGNSRYRKPNGRVDVNVTNGTGSLEGRYHINVPKGDGKRFELRVDGRVGYDVSAKDIRISVPSGVRMTAGTGRIQGSGRLVGDIKPGGSSLVLKDGHYELEVNGPIGISGLKVGDVTIDDLGLDGSVTSKGTIDELNSDRLAGTGTWTGDLAVRANGGRGVRGALMNEKEQASGNLEAGSRVKLNLTEGTFDVALPGSNGQGKVIPKTPLRGNVEGDLVLNDLRYKGRGADVELSRARTTFNLELDAGSLDDPENRLLRSANGGVNLRVLGGGKAEWDNTGLPGQLTPPVTHEVKDGDTLWGLTRKYDVPPWKIREANDIPPTSNLIRVGQTLTIPTPAKNTSKSARTTIQPGTEVDLKLTKATIGPNGIVVEGNTAATLKLDGMDARSGDMETKILGAAQASLRNTTFKLSPGPDGRYRVKVGSVQVPVRIEIGRGSSLLFPNGESKPFEIKIDGDTSFASFVVEVVTDKEGRLQLKDRQLTDVDMLLETGDRVDFGNGVTRLGGKKKFRYNGRIRFPKDGRIQFIDTVWLGVEGTEDSPALEIVPRSNR